ncbi:MAG: YfjI family protein [Paracoccaceae bacterium]|nr:YfjI family protein [Paracoccaceae bacterium]
MTGFAQIDAEQRAYRIDMGHVNGTAVPMVEEPTPLIHEGPAGDPFPVDALGPLADTATAIHDITQAPVAIGAQSLLAATSLAAQTQADVQTLGGVRPVSLFALTIAKSGERKSSCDALAMKPVREFERELNDASKEASLAFKTDAEIWETTRSKLVREAAGTDKLKAEGARADLAALGSEPEAPLLPYLTASEPTYEGLTKNLDQSRPSLGIFSDEAGQFLGGHAMNSDNRMKTISGLSKFWDGDPINRTRAGDGVHTFYGRRLCTHLMVQPVVAETFLSDPTARDQGFLARFLVCHPTSTIGMRLKAAPDPASEFVLSGYASRLGGILRRPLPLAEGTRNELELPVLSLSTDAERLLREYANALERKQAPGEELSEFTAFASKSAEQAARIAGVLAVYAGETSIRAERISNGIALADWYLSEAVRLKDGATVSADVRKAEKLRLWLTEKWPEDFISVTTIVQAGAANIRSAKEARQTIPHLSANGWLVPEENGASVKGKHRVEAWRIVRGGY